MIVNVFNIGHHSVFGRHDQFELVCEIQHT